jgi:phage terminase large subunit
MTNRDIAAMLKANNIPPSTVIVADCAEPKSIAEINQFGYHVQPSVKGADSINFGIGVIQEVDDMSITKDSTATIKEYRNYIWETDKDGN